ncbi:MAG: serine/threonine-protein kinase [Thermoanaerobaculia bacterium]|nr:serine/threonine-protein kinase [Thermoanaerobaculia bacterium]
MSIESGTSLAHYEVTSPLGKGGMGEVFRARDTKLGREVAIKILPEEFTKDAERLARFDREAKLLASLNHPNVAAIHGFEDVSGRKFLVMELAHGETLADRIRRGPLPVEEAIAIAKPIALALEAAHDRGIIHRDLKPANVMVDEDGLVKVLDFGLAKALDVDEESTDVTNSPTMVRVASHSGVILGTAAYMSPEQAKGKRVDRRADIWAYGVVLYEMLTGERIFGGETVSDSLARVIMSEPDYSKLPAGTPPHVRTLLERCLVKDPKQRLQAIGEARIALESGASTAVATTPTAIAGTAAKKRGAAGALPWVIAALLGVALVAAVLLRKPEPKLVWKSTISAPEGTVVQLNPAFPGGVALSPDGRRIAFSALDASGKTQLYVRDLDQGAARPLAGTDRAQYPFFSPDSRWVAFFTQADRTLKKIDTTGGPPVTLCTVQDGKGGSWGADDVIIFAPAASTTLMRVAATGGEPVEITKFGKSEDSHRQPRFLPDGRRFLYFARNTDPKESAVRLGSLDGGESPILMKAASQAEFASGRLLYVREQALMAQPFDLKAGKTTGEAVPIAERVAVLRGAALGLFSTSRTGVLTYHTGSLESAITLEVRDRTGKVESNLGDVASYRHVAISPDGRTASVSIVDPTSGTRDLWIYDVGRGVRTRFTFDPAEDAFPVFSRDGKWLYFASNRGGVYDIYKKALGGSGQDELVFKSDVDKTPSDTSPDGRQLVFDQQGPKGLDIFVIALEANAKPRPFRSTEFNEVWGRISPDGRWLTYCSIESGEWHVYLTTFPDAGRLWQVSTEPAVYPQWRADGREIYCELISGGLSAVAIRVEGESVAIEKPEKLFDMRTPAPGGPYVAAYAAGQRFVIVPEDQGKTDALVNLVVNWPEELEKK